MQKHRLDTDRRIEAYFAKARSARVSGGFKQKLYARIGLADNGWAGRSLMAFSVAAVLVTGLVMQQQHARNEQLQQAEREMQIAMHYMQQIGFKTLSEVNNHGIKPAIIKPVSKTMAQI